MRAGVLMAGEDNPGVHRVSRIIFIVEVWYPDFWRVGSVWTPGFGALWWFGGTGFALFRKIGVCGDGGLQAAPPYARRLALCFAWGRVMLMEEVWHGPVEAAGALA